MLPTIRSLGPRTLLTIEASLTKTQVRYKSTAHFFVKKNPRFDTSTTESMKPPFGNLEKLAFHTDPSHSEWIATRKAILIALTHQTRKQFFNLVIYVWPPSLKENMRTELVSTLETLRGRITKGTEADEDTLSILERPSFQALKRSDETLFQIIKLALKLKIPIEYHRLHSFNKGTEENSICLLKGTRFEFEEVSAILPFAATRPIELAGFGKGEKVLLPTLNSPPRIVLFDSIQDTQNLAAVIRTLYYFQVDALILPAADTCSLDSVTKIRKDFKDEVESVELKLFQDKRTKSIQRMSAGAYDLYAKRIFLTKGATRFVRSTKDSNNEKIKDSSNKLGNTTRGLPWKIVVCSPPPSGRADAQAAANYLSIYDQEEIKELKKNPLVVIFGHESSGIRKPILDLADVHLVIPRFDSCHILGERGLPAVDSLNLSVSVGIIMSYLISFK